MMTLFTSLIYHETFSKIVKASLTLFFKDNWSADEDDLNRTYYCELRGEVTGQLKNTGVPIVAVYEAAPNPIHAKLESQTLHYTT